MYLLWSKLDQCIGPFSCRGCSTRFCYRPRVRRWRGGSSAAATLAISLSRWPGTFASALAMRGITAAGRCARVSQRGTCVRRRPFVHRWRGGSSSSAILAISLTRRPGSFASFSAMRGITTAQRCVCAGKQGEEESPVRHGRQSYTRGGSMLTRQRAASRARERQRHRICTSFAVGEVKRKYLLSRPLLPWILSSAETRGGASGSGTLVNRPATSHCMILRWCGYAPVEKHCAS